MYIDLKQYATHNLRFSLKSKSTDIFKDKASNPDINFHNKKLQELSLRVKLRVKWEKLSEETFLIFHLNIRSLNRNIHKLKSLLGLLKEKFSFIILTETLPDKTGKNNSLFRIPKYVALQKARNDQLGGRIFFVVWKRINFKVRKDLRKYNSNNKIFFLEIKNKNSTNFINSGVYKAPSADFKLFKTDFKEIVSDISPSNKSIFLQVTST